MMTGLGSCHRARDPCPTRHPVEDLLGRRHRVMAPLPTTQANLVDLAYPGGAAGAQRRSRFAWRSNLASPSAPTSRGDRFLHARTISTRSAEGLSDQPSTSTTVVSARLAQRPAGRRNGQDHRSHARPPRGGCRQVAARRIGQCHRHRPQPRRYAAAGNRLRAGYAFGPRRPWRT